MKDFFKKIVTQITTLWGKWSLVQKLILIGIAVVAVAGFIAMVSVSSAPTAVPVIDAPIKDEAVLDRIITRINEEDVKTTVSSTGVIMVADEKTARRVRGILIREDLIPRGTDPWAIFDRERWNLTDFERDVNFRRTQTQLVKDHITALDDVDAADVNIVMPEKTLFGSEQDPVTAAVSITPRPGSDITENRKKIEGIQKILTFAIQGLKNENIVITDQSGVILNDFEGMAAMDRMSLIERGLKIKREQDAAYRAKVLRDLQHTFGADRVRDLNVDVVMDMSYQKSETETPLPIVLKERTPGSAYDDSERTNSITRSESTSTTKWKGTGFNPEGPAGVEGQTPPAMKDMSNLYGEVEQQTLTHNEEVAIKKTQEEKLPTTIDRITVSVNIDGEWKIKYDEKNQPVTRPDGSREREYVPVPPEVLRDAQSLIQDAIGYNASRGDSVTVRNIQYDRTERFAAEDAAFHKDRQFKFMLLILAGVVALLLVGFVIYRMVSREVERRRRVKEEQLSREQEALRESALLDAESEGVEVSMSVEERKRMELQDNAVNMAKEHPGDVAQLIRTWLLEE